MNNESSSHGTVLVMDADIRTLVGTADPETLAAPEVLGVMVEHFHPRLSLACSFQKEESVLLDMLLGIGLKTAPMDYWTLIGRMSPNRDLVLA